MSTGLFDPVKGDMIKYFIRPNDDFVLNSLEKPDADEYLFRLLREEGYERIFFIAINAQHNSVWTYDKFSYWTVKENELAKSIDMKKPETVSAFFDQVENKETPGLNLALADDIDTDQPGQVIPAMGKMRLQTFSFGPEFHSFLLSKIRPALTDTNIRSAVVFPLELFENGAAQDDRRAHTADLVASTIKELQKDNTAKSNIIVLTTPRKHNLIKCLNTPRFWDLHYWSPEVVSSLTHGQNHTQAAVDLLISYGVVVLADQVCDDELANLLLRKKLIEKTSGFESIPISKIYPLAERLGEHVRKETAHFQSIDFFKFDDHIRQLNKILEREAVLQELTQVAAKLKPRVPKAVRNLRPTDLQRVTGHCVPRYDISNAERDFEFRQAMDELQKMVGLDRVKKKLLQRLKVVQAYKSTRYPGHYSFEGKPGTGKTVVARLLGRIFKAMGLLRKGHVVECRGADLISNHVGESALKTREKCLEALDGILFVDEAYILVNTTPGGDTFPSKFEEDAYVELMAFMENYRDRICIIFAGYEDKMHYFRKANAGMESRIGKRNIITFPDYSAEELFQIFKVFAEKEQPSFSLSAEFETAIQNVIKTMVSHKLDDFSNGRQIRELFEACKDCAGSRYIDTGDEATKYTLTAADIPEDLLADAKNAGCEDIEAAMGKLAKLIGLASVKRRIIDIANRIRYPSDSSRRIAPGHYIFAGNPGTGKNEVARLIGKIFKAIGVLSKDTVVEVSRADLVAGFEGQTANKTLAVCKQALGGVLFVDEAYMLLSHHGDNGFGAEALDTIMKFMEDNRDNICVIFAGYEELMKKLMASNVGFSSRISGTIRFPDYSVDELIEIMHLMATEENLELSDSFIEEARKFLTFLVNVKAQDFGNAREVRKLLATADGNRASRIDRAIKNGQDPSTIQMNLLIAEDLGVGKSPAEAGDTDAGGNQQFQLIPSASIRSLPCPYGEEACRSKVALGAATDSAVLYIKTDRGSGTAFLISPDGYALTCDHVIDGATTIKARFRMPGRPGCSDSQHECKVINTKMDLDMALIKLDGNSFPYLPLAEEDRMIRKGEDYILSGYPFGRDQSLITFHGSIASTDMQRDENDLILYSINGEAKRGNSGSPIIAQSDGRVIGILLGSTKVQDEEINHMRPIQYFWEEFLDEPT